MIHALLAIALTAAPEVVARANGHVITSTDVVERASAARAAGAPVDARALVEDLANEAVLADEGVRLGLDREPEVVAAAREARRQAAGALLVERAIAGLPPPGSAQLEAMFRGVADSVRLQAIYVATREEGEAILRRVAAGQRTFAEEARASLDSKAAAKGGDLGWQLRAQLDPALAELAFKAPLGVASGPVAMELGWAVVIVTERALGDAAAFERRKPELARFAAEQMASQVRNHLAEELRKQAEVKLDEDFIRGTGVRVEATAAELEHTIAVVDGVPIRYRQVAERLRRLSGGREGGHFSGTSVKLELAWRLVDDQLFAASGVARKLDQDPEAVAAGKRAERLAVVRAAAARLRRSVAAPSSDEVRDYYGRHLGDFVRPGRRVCSHILVAREGQAKELRARLAKGETWDRLAEAYSIDARSAGEGGSLGVLDDRQLDAIARGGEPGLASAFRTARPGVIGAPVKTRAGWHLVKVDRPEAPTYFRLDDVKERIAARMLGERQDRAVRARLTALRATAKVELDGKAIERVNARIAKEPK